MKTIRDVLVDIEAELKLQNLWQEQEIDPAALQSREPFCCDTMQFEQWLQFILIPKMHAILTSKQPLPKNVMIAPMGEYMWQNQSDKQALITHLKDFDQCFKA